MADKGKLERLAKQRKANKKKIKRIKRGAKTQIARVKSPERREYARAKGKGESKKTTEATTYSASKTRKTDYKVSDRQAKKIGDKKIKSDVKNIKARKRKAIKAVRAGDAKSKAYHKGLSKSTAKANKPKVKAKKKVYNTQAKSRAGYRGKNQGSGFCTAAAGCGKQKLQKKHNKAAMSKLRYKKR